MRARLAIYKSKQLVELRDVVLSNKPPQMLVASPKATVPILVLPLSQVIDESLEIMLWALGESDPQNLLRSEIESASITENGQDPANQVNNILSLVQLFDKTFKPSLEAYKCAKRYHEFNLQDCREACEVHIKNLEERLNMHTYLIDEKESMADIALLPYIRQFAKIERQWYLSSPYPKVRAWLNQYLQSAMFNKVMTKYPLWSAGNAVVEFGDKQ